MALTERTRPYETLIRHNPDGSISSHHQQIVEILRDGVVVSASIEDPQPLSAAAGAGMNFTAIMGDTAAAALQENDKLTAKITAADQLNINNGATIADLQKQLVATEQRIAELTPK